jgi:lipid biosynthesis B12-binding/radical SAM protein
MKVLLISSNTATMPYPVYPLGMSVIAASLRNAGHDVALFDFLVAEQSIEALRQVLRNEKPALVGISIRNLDNVNMLSETRYTGAVGEVVSCVRAETDAPVVLGGAGYSLLPEAVLRLSGADYGIVGEGELLIHDLVRAIELRQLPPRGTIFRNLSHIDGPALRGAHYDPDILAGNLRAGGLAPVQTKRGCTLRCSYCAYPVLEGGRQRLRPVKDVVDDVETLVKGHGVGFIFFADSLFNDDQGGYLEVLREMQRRGLNVPWSAFLKPTGITEESAELMRQTGLAAAELGSDAATDTTLRGLRKPFRFAEVVRANDLLTRHGVKVAHYFMFGGPGETHQTIEEGADNIRNLRCAAAFVSLGIRVLPHTELHEVAVREGVVPPDHDLMEPVYYVSPAIDRAWAERTLQ